MKHTLLIYSGAVLFSSCATYLNLPYKDINFYTIEPGKIIFNADTLQTSNNKAILRVERKKETLEIIAKTDSITKSFEIQPFNSLMYWANLCNYGLGMIVDKDNPKRYSYPQSIYVNFSDDGYPLFEMNEIED